MEPVLLFVARRKHLILNLPNSLGHLYHLIVSFSKSFLLCGFPNAKFVKLIFAFSPFAGCSIPSFFQSVCSFNQLSFDHSISTKFKFLISSVVARHLNSFADIYNLFSDYSREASLRKLYKSVHIIDALDVVRNINMNTKWAKIVQIIAGKTTIRRRGFGSC